MAKIAVELEGKERGRTTARLVARGDGWIVEDVVCTAGPHDRPFEERHASVSIALVVAGSFQYHSAAGRDLLTPGALMLGSPGQSFECSHDHGHGDRCLSFRFEPAYFERVVADSGLRGARAGFRRQRVPPVRALAPLVARACAGMAGAASPAWDEMALAFAARTLEVDGGLPPAARDAPPPSTVARVTRVVRAIEREPLAELTLDSMAREARLSPYHFLRTFERLTGLTPHQYVLRSRLRAVATRLALEKHRRVLDLALDAGFGDVSNFNRAFKAEFGLSPRAVRQQLG